MSEIRSPLRAIRQNCLDCSNGSSYEVRECQIKDCPLWPFRFGKNPFRAKRVMTEEQKAAAVERLAKARARKLAEGSERADG